jgi:hypothetical protein
MQATRLFDRGLVVGRLEGLAELQPPATRDAMNTVERHTRPPNSPNVFCGRFPDVSVGFLTAKIKYERNRGRA